MDAKRARSAARQYRYEDPVFVLPAWSDIYVTDGDRRMTFQEAARFGDMVRGAYEGLGYTLVDVPPASVPERAAFILRALSELRKGWRAAPAVQLGAAADESSPLRDDGTVASSEASPRG